MQCVCMAECNFEVTRHQGMQGQWCHRSAQIRLDFLHGCRMAPSPAGQQGAPRSHTCVTRTLPPHLPHMAQPPRATNKGCMGRTHVQQGAAGALAGSWQCLPAVTLDY